MNKRKTKPDPLVRFFWTLASVFVIALVVVFVGSNANAQTVEQVASEVDQVEVDLQTVNSKADDARGKAEGVEHRVTTLEGEKLTVEQRIADLEARPNIDPTIEARVAALEASPGGVAQADHDALASRVTTLESGTGGTVWAMYDSAGARLGEWSSRIDVGRALITVGAFDIWAQFDVDRVSYLGIVRPVAIRFKNMISGYCVEPFVVVEDYLPLVQSSVQFYGGQVHGWLDLQKRPSPTDGHLFVVDTTTPSVFGGSYYQLNVKQECVTGALMNQKDVHLLTDQGTLPAFSPPFTVTSE